MAAEIVIESLGLRRINVFANTILVAWADLEVDGWSGESSSGDTAAPGFTEDQIKGILIGWARKYLRWHPAPTALEYDVAVMRLEKSG